MPDLFLKRTSQSELRLAHSFMGGWIFAAIGCGVAWAGWNLIDDDVGRWLVTGMGVIFTLLGIGGGLWRYDLTIDLLSRAYRGRRGFWPSPRGLQGSLSELEGVVLTRTWRRTKNNHHAAWVVSLSFPSWSKPASMFETTSETKGYRKLEELAGLLRVPAIDRTGDTEVVRAHDELDQSVANSDRATPRDEAGFSRPAEISEPPSNSGIELGIGELGGPMIVLPSAGVGVATIFLALFALPFLCFGLIALASAFGVSPVEVEGTQSAKWIVGVVFTLLGVLLELGAIFGTVANEVVREEGGAIVVTLRAFGRHYRRRELRKREIEEIAVKDSQSARASRSRKAPPPTEVVLRTDDSVVRIAGDQPIERQRWLVDSLITLARRA